MIEGGIAGSSRPLDRRRPGQTTGVVRRPSGAERCSLEHGVRRVRIAAQIVQGPQAPRHCRGDRSEPRNDGGEALDGLIGSPDRLQRLRPEDAEVDVDLGRRADRLQGNENVRALAAGEHRLTVGAQERGDSADGRPARQTLQGCRVGAATLVPRGRSGIDRGRRGRHWIGPEELAHERGDGNRSRHIGDRGHHDAGPLDVGQPGAGLAEPEMSSQLGGQPRQRCGDSQGSPGFRRLGGEDLLGEVGEQVPVAAPCALVVAAHMLCGASGGEGDRHRPSAGLGEQRVHGFGVGGNVVVEQTAGLPGRERQLTAGDLRRQAVDEQPARRQGERPAKTARRAGSPGRGERWHRSAGRPGPSVPKVWASSMIRATWSPPTLPTTSCASAAAMASARAGFSSGDNEVEASAAIDSSGFGESA